MSSSIGWGRTGMLCDGMGLYGTTLSVTLSIGHSRCIYACTQTSLLAPIDLALSSYAHMYIYIYTNTHNTHNRYHHPTQLLDAQRALRTVRSRLREGIDDPARVGVVGSSAGESMCIYLCVCMCGSVRHVYVCVTINIPTLYIHVHTHNHIGGHLSATVAAYHDAGNASALDPVDRFRSVPCFICIRVCRL
jgi:hypothetical protein